MNDLIQNVSHSLLFNSDYLQPIKMSRLDKETIDTIADEMIPRQCYSNSLFAAHLLKAEFVVFGSASFREVGFSCEHCWIEMKDGSSYDPTYQVNSGDELGECEYMDLYKVPLDNYTHYSSRIKGSETAVIDFMAMRMSPVTKHLFIRTRPSI